MKTKVLSVGTVLLGILICASAVSAQPQPIIIENSKGDTVSPVQLLDKNPLPGLDQADRLMRYGEYEKAADLLEVLIEKHPDNVSVKSLLVACYEQSKNYSKLLLFLKRQLAAGPPGYQIFRAIGRAYVLNGFPDSAATFFYMALKDVPDSERAYSSIAEIYHKFGHYRREAEFIDSARTITGDSTLMADRMGDAQAAQRHFAAATLEYLTYMAGDTTAVRATTQKLEAMMKFPESADTVMTIISERIRQQANNRYLLNTYGMLLLEQGQYDRAFAFFQEMDSLESGQGGSLVYFMRECNQRGQFAYTLKAGEYFIRNRPLSTLKNSVYFAMGEALVASGQYQKALDLYLQVSDDLLRPAHRAEAALKIGLLYKDHLGDLEKASQYLNSVTRDFARGPFDVQARFGLADIAVREADFDSAVSLYQSLQQLELSEDVLERIDFDLAEIYLFRDDYKEATSRFRQIISRYPRGFYVNDAIQYSLIISEALDEAPKQIDLFSSAEYYRYTHQDDSLEYYLTKICRVGIPSLAPISYLRLAQLYSGQKRYGEAVEAVDSLSALYGQSYFLPYGLKLKADIYLMSDETRNEALALYRELLEKYATYPFAAEVRGIIRREMPTDHS